MDIGDSPSAGLAGPSRSSSRSQRTTAFRKPYARPAAARPGNEGTTSPAAWQSPSSLSARRVSLQSAGSDDTTVSIDQSSPPSLPRSNTGLFSTLSRAITRPLSWLASPAPPPRASSSNLSKSKGGLPTSQSSYSLADLASQRTSSYAPSGQTTGGGGIPQRLTGRLSRGRDQLGDLESGPSQGLSSSMSMSQLASRGKTNFTPSRLGQTSRIATQAPFASSSRHTAALPSPNGSSRNDDSMDTDFGRRSPSPAFSSASAAIRAHSDRSRLVIGNRPIPKTVAAAATPSQPRRSGSLAPSDSASATGSHHPTANSPSFIYGFGSERRVGGLTGTALNRSLLAGTATSSPYQVPTSRSPFAAAISHRRTGSVTSQSPIGRDYARSDVAAGLASPARSQILGRPGYGSPAMSRASSIAGGTPSSSLSQLGGAFPPKSRNWSSFNLAPQRSRPSTGEELMREYTAARRAATPSMASERGSRAHTPGSVRSIQLGKRDATDALGFASLDLDEHGSEVGSAKKKQMVWDPEMGFISTEELRARQPARPVPRNEAERILDVLEGMRTPLGEARKELNSRPSTPSRLTQTIAIPLPTPSAARSRLSMETPEPPGSAGIPTRRTTRARTSTQQPEEGMRAKLQRSQRATTSTPSRRSTRQTKQAESDEDIEEDQEKASVASKVDREPTPPRRVTRGMAKAQTRNRDEVMSPPPSAKRSPTKSKGRRGANSKQDEELPEEQPPPVVEQSSPRKRTTRGKAKATSPPPKQQDEMEEQPTPLPSAEESEQPVLPPSKKSSFQVLSPSTDGSRQRSTLRQGAEKTSRNHAKSGKISAWDSDDEDDDADLPDAGQLEKIKLPTGLFPDGFKFGRGSSASSSNGDASSKTATTPASDSLLGRMGGFAPPQEPTPSVKPAAAPSAAAPKFSFKPAAPSQETAPLASSESKAASSSLPAQSSQVASSKPAPVPSNFFSAPVSSTTNTTPLDAEKKSGPVPNFFGSANKPAESGTLGKAAQSSETKPSSGGFSFTPAASSAGSASSLHQTGGDDKPAPAFGMPTSTAPTSSFSFGSNKAESGTSIAKPAVPDFFGAKKDSSTAPSAAPAATSSPFRFQSPAKKPDDEVSSQTNASKPAGFSFTPASSSSQPQPASGAFGGFKGFGAAPAAAEPSKKRDADRDEEEPAAKKTNGFSFDAPAASTTPSTTAAATNGTTTPSGGFSFNKPAGDAATKASSPAPFTFGGTSTSNKTGAPGKAAEPSSAPAPTKGGFSFTAPSSPAPFKFNQPSTSNAAASSSTPSASTTPAFGGFGASSGASSTAAPASSGGFTFNKPAGDAKTATPAASTGFGFGAAAPSTPQQQQTQPSIPGSGGDMMDDTSPSQFFKSTTTTNGSSSGTGFGGFGSGGSSAPATSTSFNFGSAASNTSKPFAFGSTADTNPPASTGGFGQPTTGTATLFGSGFGSGQTTPAATGTGGFNFGATTAPSAPASTGGSSLNFTFGGAASQPQPQAAPAGSNSSGGIFQFGGPSSQGSQPATASPSPFQFGGAGASPNPFGGMPAGPQTPPATGGPALFNIGAGGNEPTTPGGGGGGRQVRGLPSRRRR